MVSKAPARASMRKAAILVSALDHRTADTLLDRMTADNAARVRNAVLQLDDVSDDEQRAVLAEFLQAGGPAGRGDEGVELDESLARKLAVAPERLSTSNTGEAALGQPTWFGSLQLAPAESIARHLKHEHPQIIAVVLAHLPAKRSAEVVKQLPERQQADVLRRVADSDAVDPQVLHELECELERRLSGEIRAARARSTGLNAVVSILNAAGEDREEWIKKVSERDESLLPLLGTDSDTPADSALPITRKSPPGSSHPAAKRPADSGSPTRHATDAPVPGARWNAHAAHGASHTASPGFADIERLDDRGLAKLFAAADAEVTLIALSGAGEGLVTRIMRQLPARQARLLQRQMEHLGPLRLSDIEHAQQRLAQLAADLMAQGEIHAPATQRLAAAA